MSLTPINSESVKILELTFCFLEYATIIPFSKENTDPVWISYRHVQKKLHQHTNIIRVHSLPPKVTHHMLFTSAN